MPPNTDNSYDITGEWEGYYTQHNDQRSIRAEFTQQNNRITGTMIDEHTETEMSLFAAAAEEGLPPGADEIIEQQIREMIPDAGREPIRVKSVLPEKSQLVGTVTGLFVKFTKVYQGQHFIGYQVGDKGIGQVIERHSVHYSGRLSEDGCEIEGRWTIYTPNASRGYIDGSFVLKRV